MTTCTQYNCSECTEKYGIKKPKSCRHQKKVVKKKKRNFLESDLQKEVLKQLREVGLYVNKINERFQSGFPDIIIISRHLQGSIHAELKVGGKKPTPLQLETMIEMVKAGGRCYVIHQKDWEEPIEVIEVGIESIPEDFYNPLGVIPFDVFKFLILS